MVETGAWDAMRKLFDQHVASVDGPAASDRLRFGSIAPGAAAEGD